MSDQKKLDVIFSFLRRTLGILLKKYFCYSCDSLENIDGPYLLLCNHNTDLDPAFVGIASAKQIYFVATDNILRNKLLSLVVRKLFAPIIHRKSQPGISTVKEILYKLKAGKNVCMFPEGNRSFNGKTCKIADVTGKLAKRCGVTVITYRLDGGYFTQPRWGTSFRRGRLTGKIINIYSVTQLKSLTEGDISRKIADDLFLDAYESQRHNPIMYVGKHPAKGLEAALFMCPECKKIGTLHTDDKSIFCDCGFIRYYNPYGNLIKADITNTITEFDSLQKAELGCLFTSSDKNTNLFTDTVEIRVYEDKIHYKKIKKVELSAQKNCFNFGNEQLLFDDIDGLSIFSRNILSVYMKNCDYFYEIRGKNGFSALKYKYLFEIYEGLLTKNEKK